MRIGIDARFLGMKGGLGRYTEKLIKHLEKIDLENDYFVFVRKKGFDFYAPQNPRFHKVLADYRWYSFKEQFFFPFKLYQSKLDLVHFLHFNAPALYFKKFIVTIHDLTQRGISKNASTLPLPLFYLKKIVYFLVVRSVLKRAKKIIAVSNFTKKEILKYYKIKANKIAVIYESRD